MRKLFCSLLLVASILHIHAQKLTSGGKLKPEQANMDIRHYTIALDVDFDAKSINGYAMIDLVLAQPASVLPFDLLDSFNIRSITVNGKTQSFDYVHSMITVKSAKPFPAGKTQVKVTYDGKPHVAIRPPWDDGFTWTHDTNGNPWMAITAEGTGGKIYYPCKDHPSDEPNEGAELIITVPKGLVVAGPGLLIKTTPKGNKTTYDWKTNYTINNYSILFNVGKFKVVSRDYTTVNGHKVPMQFYVLEEDAAKGEHHLDVLTQTLKSREKYFGEYPWYKEKIGICETPHLGMEHQTMNAYGNKFRYVKHGNQDFDGLMDHEFGHEWWGNKVTAKDWADYWIHEGINTFGDALDILELEGDSAYNKLFQRDMMGFENKLPIVQGKDIDEESAYVGDIYAKGAFFMHSLRYIMGDSIFFPTLKDFVTSPDYTYDNLVNTDDVDAFFSKRANRNLTPLFNLFLRTTDKMEITVHRTPRGYAIALKNLDMELPLKVMTSDGEHTIKVSKKPVVLKSSVVPTIDPDGYYLTRVVID